MTRALPSSVIINVPLIKQIIDRRTTFDGSLCLLLYSWSFPLISGPFPEAPRGDLGKPCVPFVDMFPITYSQRGPGGSAGNTGLHNWITTTGFTLANASQDVWRGEWGIVLLNGPMCFPTTGKSQGCHVNLCALYIWHIWRKRDCWLPSFHNVMLIYRTKSSFVHKFQAHLLKTHFSLPLLQLSNLHFQTPNFPVWGICQYPVPCRIYGALNSKIARQSIIKCQTS